MLLAYAIDLVLANSFGEPKNVGLHYHAVIQIYRSGVWETNEHRTWRGIFKHLGENASLYTGSGFRFAVMGTDRIVVFNGIKREATVKIVEQDKILGWCGNSLLVKLQGRSYRVTPKEKHSLPKILDRFQTIKGPDLNHLLCATYEEGADTQRSYWFDGKTLVELKNSTRIQDYLTIQSGILSATRESDEDNRRVPFKMSWFSSRRTALSSTRASYWFFREPDSKYRILATAMGYYHPRRKFFEFGNVFIFSNGRLQMLLKRKGNFEAYAFDKTNKWLLGQDLYGFEMGAYDLVGVNLKTKKSIILEHGVEALQAID